MTAAELKRRFSCVPPECRTEPRAVSIVESKRYFPDRQGGFREETFGFFHAQIEEILSRWWEAGLFPAAGEGTTGESGIAREFFQIDLVGEVSLQMRDDTAELFIFFRLGTLYPAAGEHQFQKHLEAEHIETAQPIEELVYFN